MAELRIERDHPGKTGRYWREGDVVIVQLGRNLSELDQRRIIRDAEREHGIRRRRRGILPIPLIPPRLRNAARDHPTTTAAVTGIVATGVAAGAILTATLPSDEPRPRRRKPPAVAGPSPTHGPATPSPPTAPPRSGAPAPGASPSPGHGDAPAPTRIAAAAGARPAPSPPPSTRPPAPPSSSPPGTAPPAEPPPTRPPTRCLVHLDALGLVDVRLLCAR